MSNTKDNDIIKQKEDRISEELKEKLKDPNYFPKNLHEAMLQKPDEKRDSERYPASEINPTLMRFIRKEPFLGSISMNISKYADYKFPTAYVGARPNGNLNEVFMGLSPKFFFYLNEHQRIGVLTHELYHMIFQHIFTRSVGEKSYQKLWNIATDLAINSIIGAENLPEICLIPGKECLDPATGKPVENKYAEFIKKAPLMKSSDYYFEELKKIQEEEGDHNLQILIGSGLDTMDDHDGWQDLPEDIQDQIKDKVRDLMEKAAKKASLEQDWGSVPSTIQEHIIKMVSKEIDWRSVVRNFMGTVRSMERISTIRKINKKMPYIHPGVRRPLKARFACFIDQSGSMSDYDIAMLFGELENFANETELDVYHFDTAIDEDSHTVWKKGRPFPKAHRTRCGGTDFQCIADFCNRKENRGRWSGVVVLTDGYAPGMGNIVGARKLWVITEHGTKSAVSKGDLVCQMKQKKQFETY